MKRIIIAGAIFFFYFALITAGTRRLPETIIRVGVVVGERSVNLSCEGKYYLYEIKAGKKTEIEPLNDYLVTGKGSSVYFKRKKFATPLRLVAEEEDACIRINGHRYRDNLLITSFKNRLTVVNELGIDGYLYGILPAEADPAWPLDTLKAQAVVSRTYALRNLRRHEKNGFDICSETHCQVYVGRDREQQRTNEAVEETKGEVLVYNGELAQALFHASCGGHTENPNNVWSWESAVPPYLYGRKDPYCAESPHNNWSNEVGTKFMRDRLRKAGYRVGSISNISISGTSESGRAKKLKIKSSKGTLELSAAKFRLAVDTWVIKSTLFSEIKRDGNSFIFKGNGWGHGVGLCQWGAKVMGEKGKDYRDILRFYYPGADVETWDE